jgi:transposase-like protein
MRMEQVDVVALSKNSKVSVIAKIVLEQLHAVPREKLDDMELSEIRNTYLGQENKGKVSEMPVEDMLMMDGVDMMLPATGSADKVENSDSELSEMSVEKLNTLVFVESNKKVTSSANENNDSSANDNIPISHTRRRGSKKLLGQPIIPAVEKDRPFECNECEKTYPRGHGLKVHKETIHSTSNKPYSCTDCDKEFWVDTSFESTRLSTAKDTSNVMIAIRSSHAMVNSTNMCAGSIWVRGSTSATSATRSSSNQLA